eukprot:TRINITY_DN19689_c0_g1_i1.p2 TRINITY_DN19689_c0_g1~~TRINITY_DN19689_c0_g1_i1.p2  ORF type:complete len:101 (-),score=22.03 TRINITY_DN19689_c0_g1_i1:8-310(-)
MCIRDRNKICEEKSKESFNQINFASLLKTQAPSSPIYQELLKFAQEDLKFEIQMKRNKYLAIQNASQNGKDNNINGIYNCLLYTSPSPRDRQKTRMPSSA